MTGGYYVFRKEGESWRIVGEVARRPGLPARRSRAQAVRDVLGREPEDGEQFAVLQRSEWKNALDQ
jgi:hypothetical protein